MSQKLTRKNMIWSHAVAGMYSRDLTRYQFFALRNINKNSYKRSIPAVYEKDPSTDMPGQGIIPFIDLIHHKHYEPD